MPDLLYPGVYIIESAARAHAIEGVSTSTEGLVAGVEAGRTSLSIATPAWTDGNSHDLGATALELFDWAAEPLAFSVVLALGLGDGSASSCRRQSESLDPPP